MVSELIRLARWKKIDVASAASLKTQLSRWENGHVTPEYYQPLLCEVLKATPGELGFGIQDLPSGGAKQSSSGTYAYCQTGMEPRRHKQPLVSL